MVRPEKAVVLNRLVRICFVALLFFCSQLWAQSPVAKPPVAEQPPVAKSPVAEQPPVAKPPVAKPPVAEQPPVATPPAVQPPPAIQPTVAFFYGKHVPVPEVCFYDEVIVDPSSNFNPKTDCGSWVDPIAYVSVGEVAKDASYIKNIPSTWVIGKNQAWNNNLIIDQTNPAWQTFFIEQLVTPLWQKGYRGFFLDTLDSYLLAVHDVPSQQKQIDGIVNLIKQIKLRYPEAKIILNRGFQLLPHLQTNVDGVVVESLYNAWNQQKNKYEETPLSDQKILLAEIDKIKAMHLPVIIIDYLPPDQEVKAMTLATNIAKQGMIPWITNNSLDKIYINKSENIKRKILVLFNTQNNFPIRFAPAFWFLGPLIEYMGYIPTYINLNKTKQLPQEKLKEKYAGIILWLDDSKPSNVTLLNWVKQQMASQIPVVFLISFGVPIETDMLKEFGLSTSDVRYSSKSLKIAKIDPKYVGFETKPAITPYDFYPLRAKASDVLLQMKNEYQQTHDAIAITPWGAMRWNEMSFIIPPIITPYG